MTDLSKMGTEELVRIVSLVRGQHGVEGHCQLCEGSDALAELSRRLGEVEQRLELEINLSSDTIRALALAKDAMSEAEAKLKAATEWRRIETAPKDGTDIFLLFAKSIDVGRWVNLSSLTKWSGWMVGAFMVADKQPTHWLPIPLPPVEGPATKVKP